MRYCFALLAAASLLIGTSAEASAQEQTCFSCLGSVYNPYCGPPTPSYSRARYCAIMDDPVFPPMQYCAMVLPCAPGSVAPDGSMETETVALLDVLIDRDAAATIAASASSAHLDCFGRLIRGRPSADEIAALERRREHIEI